MQRRVDTVLLLQNEKGRLAMLERAEKDLRSGECLVKVVDIVGARRAVRTSPKDPRAVLVARESPLLLRGGLTSLVSYFLVPTDGLDAVETHYLHDDVSHTYDVLLNVARIGTRGAPKKPVPA